MKKRQRLVLKRVNAITELRDKYLFCYEFDCRRPEDF